MGAVVVENLPVEVRSSETMEGRARLYERGGLTVHAVRCAMGDDAFFRMLRNWAVLHRDGAVTTKTFTAHVNRFADEPLDDLFAAWVYGAQLPPLPSQFPARPTHPPTNAESA